MSDDEITSEKQSLEIISRMIHSAKSSLSDDGIFFLLWGFAVFICAMSQFILMQFDVDDSAIVWPFAMFAAGIASWVIGARRSKKVKVKTFVEGFIDYLWIGFGVSLFIVLVFSYRNENWQNTYPMIMILYGISTFVSGGALQFLPLKIGGAVCWACAVAAFFVEFEYQLLLISAAVLFGFIIPGYLLKRKYQDEAIQGS